MLNQLRHGAAGIFAKILLGLLILSFGIWGVGDMLRYGSGNVAEVGGESISPQALQLQVRQDLETLRAIYPPEQLKHLPIYPQTLDRLITQILLKHEVKALGLEVGDDQVREHIRKNPLFLNAAGQFDKQAFSRFLARSGNSENRYIEEIRMEIAGNLLLDTIKASIAPTETLVNALFAAKYAQREALFVTFEASALPPPSEPDDGALQAFYQRQQQQFTAPEYRTLSIIALDAASISKRATVDDAAIRAHYEAHRDSFTTPEKREVKQLVFAEKAQADAAYQALQQGKNFADVAASAPIVNKDAISLGKIAANQLPAAAREAVLSLSQGAVSAPIATNFGWHIFTVTAIEAAHVLPLAEVKERLHKELLAEQTEAAFSSVSRTLEDELASGTTPEEVAKKLGLTLQKLGPVDAHGNAPDGSNVLPKTAPKNLLPVAFRLNEGEDSPITAITSSGAAAAAGSYFVVRVESILPERVRSLDEVKGKVIAAWKEEERRNALKNLANESVERSRAAADARAAIERSGHATRLSQPFSRATPNAAAKALGVDAVPPMFMESLFALPAGKVSDAVQLGPNRYVAAVITRTIPAEKTGMSAEAETQAKSTLRKELTQNLFADRLGEYIDYLRRERGVSVNQALLEKMSAQP